MDVPNSRLKMLEYEDGLRAWNVPSLSLAYKHSRGDLIETFKFRKRFHIVDKDQLLPVKENIAPNLKPAIVLRK